MPETLYSDNYYYELYSSHMVIYKYNLYEQKYVKIDMHHITKLPKKYNDVLQLFQKTTIDEDIIRNLNNIKVTL